jgi:alkylated DNA repair dioxygenase AlkB
MAALPPDAPAGLLWLPDAFSPAESREHLVGLIAETDWEQHTFTIFGKTVPMPRLIQMYGPHGYHYSGVEHPPRPLTPRLQAIAERVERLTGRAFNSVLLNWYRDGADSMGWHTDDDYPHGGQPMVASVSFGAERVFRFRPRRASAESPRRSVGFVLTDGSVLGMDGPARTDWQHALPRTKKVSGARVNLTFRQMCGP